MGLWDKFMVSYVSLIIFALALVLHAKYFWFAYKTHENKTFFVVKENFTMFS